MHNITFQPSPAPLSPVKDPATHFSVGTVVSCSLAVFVVTLRSKWHMMIPDLRTSAQAGCVQA